MVMSVLGNLNSPVKTYYNIWLIVLGLLLMLSSFAIFAKYNAISEPLSIAISILIASFAIGAGILSGLFSVNENKQIETLASKIHGIGAAFGFMALLIVPLLLSILSFKSNDKTAGIVCVISFISIRLATRETCLCTLVLGFSWIVKKNRNAIIAFSVLAIPLILQNFRYF